MLQQPLSGAFCASRGEAGQVWPAPRCVPHRKHTGMVSALQWVSVPSISGFFPPPSVDMIFIFMFGLFIFFVKMSRKMQIRK